MIPNGKMAKATKSKRRKRSVPISLSSTDTYTAARVFDRRARFQDNSLCHRPASFVSFYCVFVTDINAPTIPRVVRRESWPYTGLGYNDGMTLYNAHYG